MTEFAFNAPAIADLNDVDDDAPTMQLAQLALRSQNVPVASKALKSITEREVQEDDEDAPSLAFCDGATTTEVSDVSTKVDRKKRGVSLGGAVSARPGIKKKPNRRATLAAVPTSLLAEKAAVETPTKPAFEVAVEENVQDVQEETAMRAFASSSSSPQQAPPPPTPPVQPAQLAAFKSFKPIVLTTSPKTSDEPYVFKPLDTIELPVPRSLSSSPSMVENDHTDEVNLTRRRRSVLPPPERRERSAPVLTLEQKAKREEAAERPRYRTRQSVARQPRPAQTRPAQTRPAQTTRRAVKLPKPRPEEIDRQTQKFADAPKSAPKRVPHYMRATSASRSRSRPKHRPGAYRGPDAAARREMDQIKKERAVLIKRRERERRLVEKVARGPSAVPRVKPLTRPISPELSSSNRRKPAANESFEEFVPTAVTAASILRRDDKQFERAAIRRRRQSITMSEMKRERSERRSFARPVPSSTYMPRDVVTSSARPPIEGETPRLATKSRSNRIAQDLREIKSTADREAERMRAIEDRKFRAMLTHVPVALPEAVYGSHHSTESEVWLDDEEESSRAVYDDDHNPPTIKGFGR